MIAIISVQNRKKTSHVMTMYITSLVAAFLRGIEEGQKRFRLPQKEEATATVWVAPTGNRSVSDG